MKNQAHKSIRLSNHKPLSAQVFVICCTLWFSETLVMHHFPCPQELNGVAHIRIVAYAQNVVIRRARFLLCRGWV